ncbi:cryptochrome/photolyase family protein [Dyadobacter sp. CY323]|uniref:cryptochrome/photolyase family protein n=1 Tax=Dyadobacter sp. CY323 TaxID=2907302 RepID=UPI001F1F432F|nr:cryptochrome/photolyase family protein [Dyadobacter sp. CY323]MCE6991394.1 cryptochrome/photolyase family protein [Dyadobacter sp. CY323]
MKAVNIIFPHQLFEINPIAENGFPVYLLEETLYFKQFAFHKQKIAFHRATMKWYAAFLEAKNVEVFYIESASPLSDVRKMVADLKSKNVEIIHYIDPTDNWLGQRLASAAAKANIVLIEYQNPLFLNSKEELGAFFQQKKKKFFQTEFYIQERKKRKILIDDTNEPVGGSWSYDVDNRKKYPRKKQPPHIAYPETNEFYEEAKAYVQRHFNDNLGYLTRYSFYPGDHTAAKNWLNDFLVNRFQEFGPYEDAIVKEESILHHGMLTPMLNVGLITPQVILDAVLEYAQREDTPLNSTEGFIRQIIGWREFMRGFYESKGSVSRTKNYWNFTRKIPESFYNGTTGIEPVDSTIKKVLERGYCHHIERLMVLGNFMLLCEFDPDDVYQWFMELFIDAYDWVMVPNVYAMSQFADGGLMATKPYIASSNYILKMSNYEKGPWQEIWDALFWRFMHVHRSFFQQNPRIGMLLGNFDKMDAKRQKDLLNTAQRFLMSLD